MITLSSQENENTSEKFMMQEYVDKLKDLSRNLEILKQNSSPSIRSLILENAAWFFLELGDYCTATRLLTQAKEGLSEISHSFDIRQITIKIDNINAMRYSKQEIINENDDYTDVALINYWIFSNDGPCFYSTQRGNENCKGGRGNSPDQMTGFLSAIGSFASGMGGGDQKKECDREELHGINLTSKRIYILRSGGISIAGEFYKICPEHYMRRVLENILSDFFLNNPRAPSMLKDGIQVDLIKM